MSLIINSLNVVFENGRFNLDLEMSAQSEIEYYDDWTLTPRWRTLCRSCASLQKLMPVKPEGHNLLIRATDVYGNNATIEIVDSEDELPEELIEPYESCPEGVCVSTDNSIFKKSAGVIESGTIYVVNENDQSIYYLSGCAVDDFNLYKKVNGNWQIVGVGAPNICMAIPEPAEISAHSAVSWPIPTGDMDIGEYKVIFTFSFNADRWWFDWESSFKVESNVFAVEAEQECNQNVDCSQTEFCEFDGCEAETGVCVVRPIVGNTNWDPVCGCDGKTYSNDGVRMAIGVSKRHNGECMECYSDSHCAESYECQDNECVDSKPEAACSFRTNSVNGDYKTGSWIAVDTNDDGMLEGYDHTGSYGISYECRGDVLAQTPEGYDVILVNGRLLVCVESDGKFVKKKYWEASATAVTSEYPTEPYASYKEEVCQPIEACSPSGGVWRQFTDGCVDSCYLEEHQDHRACTLALTYGCDCGPEKCWNGERCVANP
ncbi:MAG: hypothetical protein ABIF10_04275 [Candidatus Woesearchaeota archaeon]